MIEQTLDPAELARALGQREQFDRNLAWLKTQIPEIYRKYRGKCLCIAGQELFMADMAKEAVALPTAAHPDDEGWFSRYIPRLSRGKNYRVFNCDRRRLTNNGTIASAAKETLAGSGTTSAKPLIPIPATVGAKLPISVCAPLLRLNEYRLLDPLKLPVAK